MHIFLRGESSVSERFLVRINKRSPAQLRLPVSFKNNSLFHLFHGMLKRGVIIMTIRPMPQWKQGNLCFNHSHCPFLKYQSHHNLPQRVLPADRPSFPAAPFPMKIRGHITQSQKHTLGGWNLGTPTSLRNLRRSFYSFKGTQKLQKIGFGCCWRRKNRYEWGVAPNQICVFLIWGGGSDFSPNISWHIIFLDILYFIDI